MIVIINEKSGFGAKSICLTKPVDHCQDSHLASDGQLVMWLNEKSPEGRDQDQDNSVQFISVAQSCLTLCNPWTAARQATLSVTNSRSLLKLISIESVMLSNNHLLLYRSLLLWPSILPSIRVFSNESVPCIRWPKYWSFSFNISPSNEHPGLISFRMD